MTDIIEIIQLPFFQRAFVGGLFVAVLCAIFGVFVVMRKMAFFGEGVAHASLAGVAIAILASWAPLPSAVGFAILVALLVMWLQRVSRLATDTIIGVVFSASMALGVLLIGLFDGYRPDLFTYLFGNILSITTMDVWTIAISAVVLLLLIFAVWKRLVFASIDPDGAKLAGISVLRMDLFLHIALAITVVLSVKIVGIVLVAALLVLPAATNVMLFHRLSPVVIGSVLVSVVSVVFGLIGSALLDVASGSLIVLVAALIFVTVAVLTNIRRRV